MPLTVNQGHLLFRLLDKRFTGEIMNAYNNGCANCNNCDDCPQVGGGSNINPDDYLPMRGSDLCGLPTFRMAVGPGLNYTRVIGHDPLRLVSNGPFIVAGHTAEETHYAATQSVTFVLRPQEFCHGDHVYITNVYPGNTVTITTAQGATLANDNVPIVLTGASARTPKQGESVRIVFDRTNNNFIVV